MLASMFGEEIEDSLYCCQLRGLAFFPAAFDTAYSVACVDLPAVVDEEHGYNLVNIDGRWSIGRKRNSEHGDLPTVLGGVLVPVEPQGPDLARHGLEPIQFKDEVDCLLHSSLLAAGKIEPPHRPSICENRGVMAALQTKLDEITQNTRRLVQAERLAISEQAIAELFATGIEDRVLPVGVKAPEFTLPDAISGKPIRSADMLALGPLVVNFFRGRWDPYCITELEVWRDLYPQLRERGALLVAISPQTLRQSDFTVQQYHFQYPLLQDANSELAEQFGIAYPVSATLQRYYRSILVNIPFINSGKNVMAAPDDSVWKLPLPATFVINQEGFLTFSEAHADFRVRPEPEEVLAAI